MEIAIGTHPGVWQKQGGDASLAESLGPNVTLLAVADGFGSISRGLSIAQSALIFIRDFLRRKARAGIFSTRATSPAARRQLMLAALSYANSRLFSQSASHDDYVAGGASITATLLVGDQAFIGHVGTSRAYLLHEDALSVVTHDDAFSVDSPENVRSSAPAGVHVRAMLTRTLGTQPTLEASVTHLELAATDRILLCTSGLHRRISADEFHSVLRSEDPAESIGSVLALAKQRRLDRASLLVASGLTTPLASSEALAQERVTTGRVIRAVAFTLVVVLLFGLATVAQFWR